MHYFPVSHQLKKIAIQMTTKTKQKKSHQQLKWIFLISMDQALLKTQIICWKLHRQTATQPVVICLAAKLRTISLAISPSTYFHGHRGIWNAIIWTNLDDFHSRVKILGANANEYLWDGTIIAAWDLRTDTRTKNWNLESRDNQQRSDCSWTKPVEQSEHGLSSLQSHSSNTWFHC